MSARSSWLRERANVRQSSICSSSISRLRTIARGGFMSMTATAVPTGSAG